MRYKTVEKDEVSVEDIRNIIMKIPGCSECSPEDVGEWLVCDSSDPGFQILSDDELLQSVREELIDDPEDDDDIATEPDTGPSASEAFECLDTTLKWMERQLEYDHHRQANARLGCTETSKGSETAGFDRYVQAVIF